jgi:hypothetical protein
MKNTMHKYEKPFFRIAKFIFYINLKPNTTDSNNVRGYKFDYISALL